MKHLLPFFLLISFETSAQDGGLIAWRFISVPNDSNVASIVLSATIAPGWHIFSQSIGDDGPLPTGITFTPSEDFILLGNPIESGISAKSFDETFNIELVYYSKSVSFIQKNTTAFRSHYSDRKNSIHALRRWTVYTSAGGAVQSACRCSWLKLRD